MTTSTVPTRASGRPMPALEQPEYLPPQQRVGWAVMGLGNFALNQILPSFGTARASRLVALVSGDAEKAQRVASQYGLTPTAVYQYEQFERIAEDPAIQVVYNVLPNSLHAEFSVRAARAGKHVFCEKPMAVNVEECEAMIGASAQAKRKLGIAYRVHYEPYNTEAMRIIRSGELGKVRVVTMDNGRPTDPTVPYDQWRLKKALAGGGSMFDIGIYGVNAARYLTHEEPLEVMAWISSPQGDERFAEVEDLVAYQLRFPSGAIAHGSCSYSYASTSRFTVQGTEGSLILDPASDYDGLRLTVRTKDGARELKLGSPNQFALEMDAFSEAVRSDRECPTSGVEGLRDVRIMLAIYESARTGRPVQLSH